MAVIIIVICFEKGDIPPELELILRTNMMLFGCVFSLFVSVLIVRVHDIFMMMRNQLKRYQSQDSMRPSGIPCIGA